MLRIVGLTGRPQKKDSYTVPPRDRTDQRREVIRGPSLALFPRTDVYPNDGAATSQTGESLLELATLFRIGKYPGGRWGTLDPERLEQTEYLFHLVLLCPAIVGERDVQSRVSLAGLGVAEHVPCADQPSKAQRARGKPRRGDNGIVEPLPPQGHNESKTIGINRKERAHLATVFSLFVGVDCVHGGVACQDGPVIRVHQRRDMPLGIAFAQSSNERGSAHQIADVIPADHQDTGVRVPECRRRGRGCAHDGAPNFPAWTLASAFTRSCTRST